MKHNRVSSNVLISLFDLIERRNNDLLGVTNVQLVNLFWKMGKQLTSNLEAGMALQPRDRLLVSGISEELTKRYGNLFSKGNISKMRLFTEHFPDISLAEKVARILSWQHIVILLKTKDFESKLFYIDLTIRQNLSPNKLLDSIRHKVIGTTGHHYKSPKSKSYLTHWSDEWWMEMLNLSLNQNPFNRQMFSSLSKLLQPSIDPESSQGKANKENGVPSALIQEIEKFKKDHNWWLNVTLNRSFREIGEFINTHILLINGSTDKNKLITIISKKLTPKYGSNFTVDQLIKTVQFFRNVSLPVSERINALITWEHVLVIMHLTDALEQLFYARLTATEGLSTTFLKERINQNTYLNTMGAEEVEQQTLTLLQNPREVTKKSTSKNKPVAVEYVVNTGGDIMDSKVVLNILENRYFPLIQSGKKSHDLG